MDEFPINVHYMGLRPYQAIWRAMQDYTDRRDAQSPDELWVLEHEPVFTLGQAGKPEHVLNPGDIPVVQIDRGGQVTYHGPGQLIIYTLIDLRRRKLGVREFVTLLENSVIEFLAELNIAAASRKDAPGVYVNGAKIAALGLRVRHGCTFHGLSLNVDMDLEPFQRINPCGFAEMPVTQLADCQQAISVTDAGHKLSSIFIRQLP